MKAFPMKLLRPRPVLITAEPTEAAALTNDYSRRIKIRN